MVFNRKQFMSITVKICMESGVIEGFMVGGRIEGFMVGGRIEGFSVGGVRVGLYVLFNNYQYLLAYFNIISFFIVDITINFILLL